MALQEAMSGGGLGAYEKLMGYGTNKRLGEPRLELLTQQKLVITEKLWTKMEN
ncbi:MAG: hypothetical protein IPN73_14800 [Saprospiraceae bacterium]|nr:hypothetical protein [Saprospiraceae bacterium]MBK7790328.1 hypothetical protein [Saprospiraceae bacterium]MBK8112259.1 hypothetical protein [Saprospiraceae bacterium]MBK8851399.1 hypothetical protein [Saprospiraceae bacterium]